MFICMAIGSLVLGIVVSQVGLSQIYFIRAALPFYFVLLLRIIENKSVNKFIAFSVCFIASIGIYKSFRLLLPICNNGWSKLVSIDSNKYDYGGLSKDELLGLRWIRDNIYPSAVIATNKMIEDERDVLGRSRSFATSTYSEHQVYVEGTEYSSIIKSEKNRRYELMKRLYKGDSNALSEVRKEGVAYVVQFRSVERYGYTIIEGKKVFENKAIVVYEI